MLICYIHQLSLDIWELNNTNNMNMGMNMNSMSMDTSMDTSMNMVVVMVDMELVGMELEGTGLVDTSNSNNISNSKSMQFSMSMMNLGRTFFLYSLLRRYYVAFNNFPYFPNSCWLIYYSFHLLLFIFVHFFFHAPFILVISFIALIFFCNQVAQDLFVSCFNFGLGLFVDFLLQFFIRMEF